MVNVNTVYQTVLALADKDQGGYITPQEFNLFANHAQNEIFEQYFYDLNQFKRIPGNQSDSADMTGLIKDKLSLFRETILSSGGDTPPLPDNFYRIMNVSYGDNRITCEQVERADQTYYTTPLLSPTKHTPIFYMLGSTDLDGSINRSVQVRPSVNVFRVHYYRKPAKPNWTYIVSQNAKKPLYNGSALDHQHFELHPSEEKNLVHKILQLAGVSTKDFNTAQFANAEEAKGIQQEKS